MTKSSALRLKVDVDCGGRHVLEVAPFRGEAEVGLCGGQIAF